MMSGSCKCSPLNLEERDLFKGILFQLLHCHDCGWPGGCAVSKFCCTPKLFNKVQLAVILWVEVTQVATFVKTLQGLGMLNMSMVAVDARVQWFNGSVIQRRV